MGKKAKEHRKKVQARNARIKAEQNRMKKMYTEMFNKQMEEMKSKLGEDLKIESNGQEVPFEIINETVTEQPVEEEISELEK